MTTTTLLESLTSRGFSVWVEGDAIKVSPSSALTDEDRQSIRGHKAELLALLQSRSEPEAVEEFTLTPDADENLNPPEGGKAQKAQKSPANRNRAKWKPVTTVDIQTAAERRKRRMAGEDELDLPASIETPTLDARTKRKSDPLPPDGMCPGCAEPPRFQGHDAWWCPTCRRWFAAADESEPSEPRVKEAVPTSSPTPEPPKVGTWARPRILHGARMPWDCPWSTCNGWLVGSNPAQCSKCKTVFELKPPLTGTYVGDLADDGGDVAEWVM